MEQGIGAGLAALAFWGFISALIVAGVWDGAKKRETQHETLRRIIEGGQPLDDEMRETLLGNGSRRPDRGLKIGGIIALAAAAGFAILGLFVGLTEDRALMPILGFSALIACVAIGLLVASSYVRRWMAEDAASSAPPSTGA